MYTILDSNESDDTTGEEGFSEVMSGESWKCTSCGTVNVRGKFCTECGTRRA